MVGFIYLLVALAFMKLTYDAWKWTAVDDQDAKQAIHNGRSSFTAVLMTTLQFMKLETRRKLMMIVFAIVCIVFFVLFFQNFGK